MLREELLQRIDNNSQTEIANRISTSRELVQISSQEMADLVGLGYEQYRRIERGEVLVKTEYLYVIAKCLNVSTDYLLYGDRKELEYGNISQILERLSTEELTKAERVLKAVFG